jgi:DeoR family fructose operon transcriptional repressor
MLGFAAIQNQMIKEKRHTRILELIKHEKLVTIQELSKQLGVSYMTITRDLEELEMSGAIQRIRGGAMSKKDEVETHNLILQLYDPKQDPAYAKKVSIGRYAATHLVEDGDYITIEAGTTASSMVPYLKQSNLTVLTNGLLTSMMIFPSIRKVIAMCSGGILIETGAFTGPQAEDFFAKFRVKRAFLGAKGLTIEDGFTDPSPLYIRLKNVMKQNTQQVILLVDSSKIGVRSLIQVVALDEVSVIVTDSEAPQLIVDRLREKGIDVRIANAF